MYLIVLLMRSYVCFIGTAFRSDNMPVTKIDYRIPWRMRVV